jgi:hypothetical protein
VGKAKTAQKWVKKEKEYTPPFFITGGPLNGYMIFDSDSANAVGYEKNMWDAIKVRDSLIKGKNAENLAQL